MKIRGTDFVVFKVTDLPRAAAFYREVLGLPQELYNEEYRWAEFDCGNVTLALESGAKSADVPTAARLALAVEDVQAAYQELMARGVPLAGPPQDHGCCQHVEVTDPDGHHVILHHRADGTYGQGSK